jgi:PAS domain-containing protein
MFGSSSKLEFMTREKSFFSSANFPLEERRASAAHAKKQSLRERAERELARHVGSKVIKEDDALLNRWMELHELHVHQIELEMQNDELQQAYLGLTQSRAQYVQLYDKAPVGYCTIDLDGLLIQLNLTLSSMLGFSRDALLRKRLTEIICRDDQDILYKMRRSLG